MWHDLFVAVALLFVIEGVWPFLSPVGVGLLYLVN